MKNAFGAADENSLSIPILQAFFAVSLNKRGYCYKEPDGIFADVEQVRSLFTNALNFGVSYSHAINDRQRPRFPVRLERHFAQKRGFHHVFALRRHGHESACTVEENSRRRDAPAAGATTIKRQ